MRVRSGRQILAELAPRRLVFGTNLAYGAGISIAGGNPDILSPGVTWTF